MAYGRRWFIPLLLDNTELPDNPIGPNETLRNLNYIDFTDNWERDMTQLVAAVSPSDGGSVTRATHEARSNVSPTACQSELKA